MYYSNVHAFNGAFNLTQFLSAYVRVYFCGLTAFVVEQFLYVTQIGTGL